mmetsp:Transcript_24503/g.79989  ORF Transcript_24503/g.79989 Transcript_24503/m.79989 type:complete len:255 (+) Transcript_24503:169-933(+)
MAARPHAEVTQEALERVVGVERLERHVEAEPPVMLRIGRVVDGLLRRRPLCISLVQSEQVLNWEDGERRGGAEMRVDDGVHHRGRARLWGAPPLRKVPPRSHRSGEERLSLILINLLIPPSRRGHVVARRRADGHVSVFERIAKFALLCSAHALDAQAEEPEVVERARNAVRNHTEILTADEHFACFAQRRQCTHSILAPKVFLANKKVVVVEAGDCFLRPRVELLEARGAVEIDARVKVARLLEIAKEDDVLQ